MKKYLIPCLFLCLAPVGQARLGYTLDQCNDAYGKETASGELAGFLTMHVYHVGDTTVSCCFVPGSDKVAAMGYSREAPSFSTEEVKQFLALNCPNLRWDFLGKATTGGQTVDVYNTEDHKWVGYYNHDVNDVTIGDFATLEKVNDRIKGK
jgi:hypothetical protein